MVMSIFQGSLGSGKSASMMLDMVDHLDNGGCCAANFTLLPGWSEVLAKRFLTVRLGLRDPLFLAGDYWERFRTIGNVESMWKVASELLPFVKGKVRKQYEGRIRLYIDEAQLFFNSRNWGDNKEFIHFFSQSRKLKLDIVIVAHDASMIDKQIRNFFEYEYRFRNLQKIKLPLIPISASPVPCFLGVQRYAGRAAGAGQILSWKLYPFVKFLSQLYDSSCIFGNDLVSEPFSAGPDPRQAVSAPVKKDSLPHVIPSYLCSGW